MQPVYYLIPNTEIAFIGMPKCGNSSILHALRPFLAENQVTFSKPQKDFLPYAVSAKEIADRRSNLFIFSISRNPYARAESHYFDKVNGRSLHSRLAQYGFYHRMPFSEYCQVLSEQFESIKDLHVRPQHKINNFKGTFLPNLVLRFERLTEDFEIFSSFLERKYQKKIILPHLNKSERPLDIKFDTKERDLLYTLYQKDFSFGGYQR
jgi:hypothetical protein